MTPCFVNRFLEKSRFRFATKANTVANVDDVCRMAKWFAGHIDVVKAGTKVGSVGTKGGVKRQSNCPVGGAANLPPRPPVHSSAGADVIVLDESSDDEPTPGPMKTRHVSNIKIPTSGSRIPTPRACDREPGLSRTRTNVPSAGQSYAYALVSLYLFPISVYFTYGQFD